MCMHVCGWEHNEKTRCEQATGPWEIENHATHTNVAVP